MSETAPPPTASTSPSPMALVATILGGIGLLFSLMGCMFMPLGMAGGAMCLVALILGYVEYRRVGRGESPESNRTLALVGTGLGGGGCLVSGCYTILLTAFIVLYFVLVFGVVILTAVSGN